MGKRCSIYSPMPGTNRTQKPCRVAALPLCRGWCAHLSGHRSPVTRWMAIPQCRLRRAESKLMADAAFAETVFKLDRAGVAELDENPFGVRVNCHGLLTESTR